MNLFRTDLDEWLLAAVCVLIALLGTAAIVGYNAGIAADRDIAALELRLDDLTARHYDAEEQARRDRVELSEVQGEVARLGGPDWLPPVNGWRTNP